MATLNFDATNVPVAEGFDPIPPGWYNAQIMESDLKTTKDSTGAYLALTFQVLDGQYKGRKVFTNLNLQNANPVASRIANEQLSAICHATGIIQVQDSAQLHGIPLMIKVSVRPANAQYDASNEIKGFKKIEGGAPAGGTATATAPAWAQPSSVPPAASPMPAAASAPPWAQPSTPAPQAAPPPVVQAPPPVAPPVTPTPAAGPRMNPPPPYQEGDVVNGHQLKNNAWVPYTAPAPTAPPVAPVAPPAPPPGVPDAAGSAVPPWQRQPGT